MISDGGRFGIRIGDTEASVRSRLTRDGLTFYEKSADLNCGANRLDQSSVIELYGDSGWRGGVICVGYRNGIVQQVAWNYIAFAL